MRFGINESVDCIIIDINGRKNLAGSGINHAQRVMSIADGNQVLLAVAAYETLGVRDQYHKTFRACRAEIKHGRVVKVYQFIGDSVIGLNV